MKSLVSINIPSSVEFIRYCGIHCFNDSTSETSLGTLTVVFNPESNISYIDRHGICRKQHIIIYYLGYKSPLHHNDPFFRSFYQSLTIFSPHVSSFCGYRTKSLSTCSIFHLNWSLQTTIQYITLFFISVLYSSM